MRIEEEASNQAATDPAQSPVEVAEDPQFGVWAERTDMADLPAYVRKIRAARFNSDGTHTGAAGTDAGKNG